MFGSGNNLFMRILYLLIDTHMPTKVAQHQMIFNGKRMVQRIVSHEGYKPVVTHTQEGGEVKPIKVVKENKKADRARIAAELFKTL
jgi:hypothetical protein